jgi:hypothetical protein
MSLCRKLYVSTMPSLQRLSHTSRLKVVVAFLIVTSVYAQLIEGLVSN